MKVALYTRVSSETQSKEGTIHSQIEELRKYAGENDLKIIDEFIDDGFSGSDLNRPELDRLRDLAPEGIFQGVLVLSPDRLSRKQSHQFILIDEFEKRNIKLIFTNIRYGDSPEDQFMLQIQGAVSEYERAKILDRTRRGRKHAIKNGQVVSGQPPYGYKYVPKSNGNPGSFEIDPDESELVKNVFDWYVNDRLNLSQICQRLTREGYTPRSGLKWWAGTISGILQNETYLGTFYMYKTISVEPKKHPKLDRYRKKKKSSTAARPREEWIGVPVDQIIDQEIWDAAQKMRNRNIKQSSRNNTKNNYLLRGLVVCGLCGSMAPGHVSNKKTYYRCGAKRNKNLTTNPHEEKIIVRKNDLDQKVWDGLSTLLYDPKKLKGQLLSKSQRNPKSQHLDHNAMNKIETDIERLEIQESRIIDAYREGVIDLDELKDQKEKIKHRLDSLEVKKKAALSIVEGPGMTEISESMLDDLSTRYQRVVANADFETKSKITNLMVNRVVLYQDKAIIEGNIPVDNIDALTTQPLEAPQVTEAYSLRSSHPLCGWS